MTKDFLHGRTEAVRTVQPESVDFTKLNAHLIILSFLTDCLPHDKIRRLHKACERDRLVFLLAIPATGNLDLSPDNPILNGSIQKNVLPSIFADPGWNLLSTSILSTSNCRNPALRLFDLGLLQLMEVQRILIQLHRSANERPAPFVDHAGILRDSKTGRPINGHGYKSDESRSDYEDTMHGYSFFDSGDIDLLGHRKRSPCANIGKVLPLSDH
ncbi:hypothetical protein EDD22DRAFT_893062 [Suillus occidentalis]|nr:hypothetical protein EDD22DRAFT_893062 [Suillus occidentalis]